MTHPFHIQCIAIMNRKPEYVSVRDGEPTNPPYFPRVQSDSGLGLQLFDSNSIYACSCALAETIPSTSAIRHGYLLIILPFPLRLRLHHVGAVEATCVAVACRELPRAVLASRRTSREATRRTTGRHVWHSTWRGERHTAMGRASSARARRGEGEGWHSHRRTSSHVRGRERRQIGWHTTRARGHVWRRERRHVGGKVGRSYMHCQRCVWG
jgi:hypothetical protein